MQLQRSIDEKIKTLEEAFKPILEQDTLYKENTKEIDEVNSLNKKNVIDLKTIPSEYLLKFYEEKMKKYPVLYNFRRRCYYKSLICS